MPDPRLIPNEKRLEIAETVRREPKTSLRQIAKRFGVTNSTVRRYCNEYGVDRAREPVGRPRTIEPYPAQPELRPGGVWANEEQMAARMGLTLKQYRKVASGRG